MAARATSGATGDRRRAGSGHQAQTGKMGILTERAKPDTVSVRQERPGYDVLTTFQNSENTRLLIVRNTKAIILI